MNTPHGSPDLDPADRDLSARLTRSLGARANGITPVGGSTHEVRQIVASRRRNRSAAVLGVACVLAVGGLAFANHRRGGVDTPVAGLPAVAPATTRPSAAPATNDPNDGHNIPLPQVTYPRDPANNPQPTKVSYTVVVGDTIESIAAKLGLDPATLRTQVGGTITVGQVISVLVGPGGPPAPGPSATIAPATNPPTTFAP